MERGAFPEMPWVLRANASLSPTAPGPPRILSRPIFEAVPSTQLSSVLAAALEEGYKLLQHLTEENVLRDGKVFD